MPSRKQRRRRQKARRHEYEFVYVDEEGQEVEPEPADVEHAHPRRNGKREAKPEQRKKGENRPVRVVQPPSWNRVARRALIFFPLIFIAFSLLNSKQAFATRLAVAALYTAFFIPFMYLMDRAMYRTYLKRTGQAPPRTRDRRR
jgi:hypothetical protein